MFDTLVKAVTDWPVLVQGVIGSAIFWLILITGQRLVFVTTAKYSSLSKKRRKTYLLNQSIKYGYKLTEDNQIRSTIFSALLYRASRKALLGCIWLTLGLFASAILPVFGAVGFLGALIYFFEALNTVTPVPETDNAKERFAEINEELKSLSEA